MQTIVIILVSGVIIIKRVNHHCEITQNQVLGVYEPPVNVAEFISHRFANKHRIQPPNPLLKDLSGQPIRGRQMARNRSFLGSLKAC